MAVDFASAVSAYRNAANMGSVSDAGSMSGAAATDKSFASMVRGAVEESIEAQHQSEAMSMAAIEGKADLRDVVMAVNNAEMTLNTVVAVRDKVVSAYETILRMPI